MKNFHENEEKVFARKKKEQPQIYITCLCHIQACTSDGEESIEVGLCRVVVTSYKILQSIRLSV